MMKFDHLAIPVTDLTRSRSWYTRALGLKVEFEVLETVGASRCRTVTALQSSFKKFLRLFDPTARPCGSRSPMSRRPSPSGPPGASTSPTARRRRIGAMEPS
jgi:catechol 2,3-dioxygenase-like lactoylglutathione lyase family enzyme